MDALNVFGLLVGHMAGDYLLQNDFMAMNKKKWSLLGWFACALHCFVYALAVCYFAGWLGRWDLFAAVMLGHMVFDKTYLVVNWMSMTGSFRRLLRAEVPVIVGDGMLGSAVAGTVMAHKVWAYALVDNSFHLVALWATARWLA